MASARLCAMGHQPVRLIPIPGRHTREVMRSKAGDGYGIMLGDGLACWDFDHVDFDQSARAGGGTVSEAIYARFRPVDMVCMCSSVVGAEFPA